MQKKSIECKFCICKQIFSSDTRKTDGVISHAACKLPFRCEFCESDNPRPAVVITSELIACDEHKGRGNGSLLLRHR